MQELMKTLTEDPGLVMLLSAVFGLVVFICNRYLLGTLLKMHRSKTAVKKIEKQYTFSQKFHLHHVRDHCVHAKKFCRRVIILYHANLIITMFVCTIGLLGCFRPSLELVGAYAVLVQFCVIVVPVTVMEFVLTNHPFDKRKRRYHFADKHNSDDHESLF